MPAKKDKMTKSILISLFLLFPIFSVSESPLRQTLSLYKITDLKSMPAIAEKYEVTEKISDGFTVIAPLSEASELYKLSPSAQLLKADISEPEYDRALFLQETGLDYRNWSDVQNELKTMNIENPLLTSYIEYGKSQQGRPLLALKIGAPSSDSGLHKQEIMITAATHGDEVITTEIVLNLMHRLLDGYRNQDPRMKSLVDNYDLYFIPVVNPDGYYYRLRYDNNLDPNRSYPFPKNPNARPTASIAGLIEFFHAHQFVGTLDFHASGKLVMYPWAYTDQSIPEENKIPYDQLAQAMTEKNHYTYGQISQVIYVAQGSSADYYYWKNKSKAFAIEVGTSKEPVPSKIAAYTEEQAEPLWKFIESF